METLAVLHGLRKSAAPAPGLGAELPLASRRDAISEKAAGVTVQPNSKTCFPSETKRTLPPPAPKEIPDVLRLYSFALPPQLCFCARAWAADSQVLPLLFLTPQ